MLAPFVYPPLLLPGVISEVFASMHIQSACSELVIHIFCPFMTQSSPSLTAVVFTAATSEPPEGSLTPMQATCEDKMSNNYHNV